MNRAASRPWAHSHPGLARRTTLPVADIEGVSVETSYAFPAPLAGLLRSWVERYRQEELAASLAALEDAIRRDRQRERRNR